MDRIIQILVIILVFWLIVAYLIPLLPAPISTLVTIILVVMLIGWLLNFAGLSFPYINRGSQNNKKNN